MKLLDILVFGALGFVVLVTAQNRVPNFFPPTRRISKDCIPRDCKIPDCFCTGKSSPLYGVQNGDLPQMVMLTFDDAIVEEVYGYYEKIFGKGRENPNGCPISATFYLSNNWTDYELVKNLYLGGHEIASHTITHRMPQHWWTYASYEDWERELEGQRDNIQFLANIPKSMIRGGRVPYLETGGDAQFQMMVDKHFEYDSSFMTGPHDEGGVWPFTLDYPPGVEYCSNNNCPKSSFPGFWEIPLNRMVGPDGKACPMADFCQTQPHSKEDTLAYLWKNFHRFYRGNRAPMGLHLHATWFQRDDVYFDAVDEFIDMLSKMSDVYLVTEHQVVDWMRRPVTKKDAATYEPWMTSCASRESREKTLVKVTTTQSTTPTPTTTTTTTTALPTTTIATTAALINMGNITQGTTPSTTLHPLIRNGFFGGPPTHWKPEGSREFSRRPALPPPRMLSRFPNGGPKQWPPGSQPWSGGFPRRPVLSRLLPPPRFGTSGGRSQHPSELSHKTLLLDGMRKQDKFSTTKTVNSNLDDNNDVLKMNDKTSASDQEISIKPSKPLLQKPAPFPMKIGGINTIGRSESQLRGKTSGVGQATANLLTTCVIFLAVSVMH